MNAPAQLRTVNDVPGWFSRIDQAVFEQFLSADAVVPTGDLVELGTYLGKSAVLIGRFKAPDETFTVCDLFGSTPADNFNERENQRSYATLDRQKFEQNYLAFFDELPVVVQDYSSAIVDHVPAGSARFVHVDASHLYEHVAVDVESARRILKPEGVVAFDDFRHDHTPGVAAAVWEAVFSKSLRPICVTPHKLYGTFGDPGPHQERLEAWLKKTDRFRWETQFIAGSPIIRMWYKHMTKPAQEQPSVDAAKLAKLAKRVDAVERDVAKLHGELKRVERSTRPLTRRVVRKLKALAARRK